MPEQNNIQKLHTKLSQNVEGFTASYEDFEKKIQDEDNLKKLHEKLPSMFEGFSADYDSFKGKLFEGYDGTGKKSKAKSGDYKWYHALEDASGFSPISAGNAIGLGRGIKVGGRDMVGQSFKGFYEGAKQVNEGLGRIAPNNEKYQAWIDSERDRLQKRIDHFDEENEKTAGMRRGGAAEFVGSMIPQTAMLAASIASGNPVLADAALGSMATSAVGSGMSSYEDYKKSTGQEIDEGEKWAVGLAYGVAEFAMEKAGLDKLMPKPLKAAAINKVLSSNMDETVRAGKEMMETFAKNNPSKQKALVQGLKRATMVEGGQEGLTELVQAGADHFITGDEQSFKDLMTRTGQAIGGGMLMGGMLAPFSVSAASRHATKRREQQGSVMLTQDAEGNVYELITDNNGNYRALSPDGTKLVNPDEVMSENVINIPTEVFNDNLQRVSEGQKTANNLQVVLETQQKYQPYTSDNGEITTVQDRTGNELFIQEGDVNDADGMLIVADQEGNQFEISTNEVLKDSKQVTHIDNLVQDALMQEEQEQEVIDNLANTEEASRNDVLEQGQPVNYQGKEYSFEGLSEDQSTALLMEENEKGELLTIQVPIEELMGNPAMEAEVSPEASPEMNPEVNPPVAENAPIQIPISEKESLNATQQEDGGFLIENEFADEKTAQGALGKLKENFDEDNFTAEVIEEEIDDPNALPWAKVKTKKVYKGIRISPKVKKVKETVQEAEADVNTEPTEAQKEAGNYKKGHTKIQGLDITIENPKGSERSGTDSTGKKWKSKMNNTYGYFKRTKGKDGDQIDTFIGENTDSDKVFVVDQVDPKTGKFDEHKVMVGFDSKDAAAKAYNSNYEKGWKGMGAITEMTMEQFKEWSGANEKTTKVKRSPVGMDLEGRAFFMNGKTGIVNNEGNGKLVFDDGNQITEINETNRAQLKPVKEALDFAVAEDGSVELYGKKYTPEKGKTIEESVTRNKEGEPVSVTLQDAKGNKRTFRNEIAQQIAYEAKLGKKQKGTSKASVNLNKAKEQQRKAHQVLSKIAPKVRVRLYTTTKDFLSATKHVNGEYTDKGLMEYNQDTGEPTDIHINVSQMDDTTIFHEVAHAVFSKALHGKTGTKVELVKELRTILKKSEDADLISFATQYYDESRTDKENADEIAEEFLAEFTGKLANGKVPKKTIHQIKELLNKLYKKLTGETLFKDTDSAYEVYALFDRLAFDIRRGNTIDLGSPVSNAAGYTVDRTRRMAAKKQTVALRKREETLEAFGLSSKDANKVREIGEALQKRTRKVYGKINPESRTEKSKEKIAGYMVEEILFELETNKTNSAVGWYTTKYQKALDELAKAEPSLKTQDNRDLFTMFLAVTSDGQKVDVNFKYALQAYKTYKEKGKLTKDDFTGGGDRAKSIKGNLERISKLLETKDVKALKFELLQESTVKELKAEAKARGEEFKSNYLVTETVPKAAGVFGEKLGSFYANLSGSAGYLTMDRWWTRTFNRYRGTLLPVISGLKGNEFNSKGKKLGLAAFKELVGQPDITDRKALSIVKKHWKTYHDRAYKGGTPVEKAANTIYKAGFIELMDAPQNGGERSFMIATIKAAQEKLSKEYGYDLSIADMQAILWYYEKKLYRELGGKDSKDVSYEESAKALAGKVKLDSKEVVTDGDFSYVPNDNLEERLEAVEEMANAATAVDETSDAYPQMTEDGEGNYLFYHKSRERWDVIDPSKAGTNPRNVTSQVEIAAMMGAKQSMYYTRPDASEGNKLAGTVHVVRVPKNRVYDADTDARGFENQAKELYNAYNEKIGRTRGWDNNARVAWISKVANENGFDMVVARWKTDPNHALYLRAQTTKPLTPEKTNPKAESNFAKGWRAEVPQTRSERLGEVYTEIYRYQNNQGKYDDLYRLGSTMALYDFGEKRNPYKNQDDITELIEKSDLPQNLKNAYDKALNGELGELKVEQSKRPVAAKKQRGTTNAYTGEAFRKFFSDVTAGKKGYSDVPYTPVINLDAAKHGSFVTNYVTHRGNFDDHIAKSIPAHREIQVISANAIADVLPTGGEVLDIGGSENSWAKSLTETGTNIKTTTLEPEPAMHEHSKKTPVEGNTFIEKPFMHGWTEDDGTVIEAWKPEKKFDVVHESMVFQFISGDRHKQFQYIKDNVLKDNGVLVVEQKVAPDGENDVQWKKNEAQKDEYKNQYFTKEEMEKKQKEVLRGNGDSAEGMNSRMVTENQLEAELLDKFKHVYRYWESGNFKGYVASNDKSKVDTFAKSVGKESETPFTTKPNGYVRATAAKKQIDFQKKKAAGHFMETLNQFADKKEQEIAKKWGDRARELIQDQELPIRRFVETIENISGAKLKDKDNPYKVFTLKAGRAETLLNEFEEEIGNPIVEAIAKLRKKGFSEYDVMDYLIAKHAPERNAMLREQKLQEYAEDLKKVKVADGTTPSGNRKFRSLSGKEKASRMAKKIKELQDEDFAGITELMEQMGKEPKDIDKFANAFAVEFERKAGAEKVNGEWRNLTDGLWEAIKKGTDYVLDTWKDSGKIDQEYYDTLKNQHQFFVPLRGWRNAADQEFNYHQQKGKRNTLKRAGGRKTLAHNPIANLFNIAQASIAEKMDSEIRDVLLQMAKKYRGKDYSEIFTLKKTFYKVITNADGKTEYEPTTTIPSLSQIQSGEYVSKIHKEHQRRRTPSQANEHEVEISTKEGDFVVVFKDVSVAHAFNHINTLIRANGKPVDFQKFNQAFGSTIGVVNNYLKQVYTSWNIAFAPANFIRDVQLSMAIQYIDNGGVEAAKTAGYVPVALGATRRYLMGKGITRAEYEAREKELGKDRKKTVDEIFYEFRTTGGQTGWTHLKTPEEYAKEINKRLNRQMKGWTGRNATAIFRGYIDFAQSFSQWFEDGVRFAVYYNAIKQGRDAESAAIEAKEITVNFNRKGKATKGLDSIYAFINPAIQGLQRFGSLTKRNPAKSGAILAASFGFGFLNAMMNVSLMGEDEEKDSPYYNISDWMRRNYIIIPNGKDKYFTIPIPQIFRGVFSMGVIAHDLMSGKTDADKAAVDAGLGIFGSISPVDIGGVYKDGEWSLAPIMPTVGRPIVEHLENKNFTGRPIKKEGYTKDIDQRTADHTQHMSGTNSYIKAITDGIFKTFNGVESENKFYVKNGKLKKAKSLTDINPAVVEHYFKAYTGGTGGILMDVIETVHRGISPKQDIELRNIPVAQRFYRSVPSENFRYIREFKEYQSFYKDIKSELKELEEANDSKQTMEMYRNYGRFIGYMDEVSKDFNEMWDERQEASPKYKDKIDERLDKLTKKAVLRIRKIKK